MGEKAQLLAKQNIEVERKNAEVEQARQALEEKAKQLALTSKYKSEFLANMSHELRTPLNSLLILSDQLAKNNEGNLTPRQIEFAKTIHSSGNDLLALINDILDLSKIESGTVIVDVGPIAFEDLQSYVDRTFRHVAESRKLEFDIDFAPNLPHGLRTDLKRLQQVLKNLLSNAFKFTEHGKVTLQVNRATEGWRHDNESLSRAGSVIAFSVSDTGIGIPRDKQQIIFEAFQQADGSTSRRYGGTGLGLAISREIARLLGGEIHLESIVGRGSSFTLYLPESYLSVVQPQRSVATIVESTMPVPLALAEQDPPTAITSVVVGLQDDRDNIRPDQRVVLIVENDLGFARILLDTAHEQGFKVVVCTRGAEAVALVQQVQPHAITLDLHLPDIEGYRVLGRLKEDTSTRHIPVWIISTEDNCLRGLKQGAVDAIPKPFRDQRLGGLLRPPARVARARCQDGARRRRRGIATRHARRSTAGR